MTHLAGVAASVREKVAVLHSSFKRVSVRAPLPTSLGRPSNLVPYRRDSDLLRKNPIPAGHLLRRKGTEHPRYSRFSRGVFWVRPQCRAADGNGRSIRQSVSLALEAEPDVTNK